MAKQEHINHISKDITNNIYVEIDEAKAGLKKISTDFLVKKIHEYLQKRRKVVSETHQKVVYHQLSEGHRFWACTVHQVQVLMLE